MTSAHHVKNVWPARALYCGRLTQSVARRPQAGALVMWRRVLVAAVVLLLSHESSAQVTGMIEGTVRSTDGLVVPGATIALVSAAPGSRSTVTGSDGSYRFASLAPGSYTVRASLAGFAPAAIDVAVSVSRVSTADITLAVGAMTDAVTVLASAAAVDQVRAQIATALPSAQIESLPVARQIVDIVDLIPGVTDRGAYGAGGGIEDKYAKGSATTAYLLNGVDVSNVDRGTTWVNPALSFVSEVQVLGPGAGAEFGDFTGAAVNVVTKPGTRVVSGNANYYRSLSSLMSDNSGGRQDLLPRQLAHEDELTADLSGPLGQRGSVFAGIGRRSQSDAPAATAFFNDLRQTLWHTRTDWRLPGGQLSAMANADAADDANLGLTTADGPEIGFSESFQTRSGTVRWQSAIGRDTLIDLSYLGFSGRQSFTPVSGNDIPRVRDIDNQRTYNSSGQFGAIANSRHGVSASITHHLDAFLGRVHDLKVGVVQHRGRTRHDEELTGGAAFFTNDDGSSAYVYAYTGYRIHAVTDTRRTAAYAQDDVRLGSRLSANVGVRLDHTRIEDAQANRRLARYTTLSPRLGLVADVSGTGRSVVRAHLGRYAEKVTTQGLSTFGGTGFSGYDEYEFFLPQPVDFRDVATFVAQLVPENLISSGTADVQRLTIDPAITGPSTWAYTMGAEHELRSRLVLALDYISKRDGGVIAREDTVAHDYVPFQFTAPTGQVLDLVRQTDGNPARLVVTNAPYYRRRHHLAILSLRHRPSRVGSLLASLAYQRSTGTTDNEGIEAVGLGNPSPHTDPNRNGAWYEGRLSFDRTWQFKVSGDLRVPWGVRLGANLQWLSGRPWASTISSGSIPELRGTDFYELLLEPRGSRRFASTRSVNLRLSKVVSLGNVRGQPSRAELILDGFNLLNDDAPLSVGTLINGTYPVSGQSSFGQPLALVTPRQFRVGVRWSF